MGRFQELLTEGKPNSLGRTDEVISEVLENRSKLDELFECLFSDDEYVRLRASDGLEKICRVKPQWLEPYVERLLSEVSLIDQPSVRWHLAEMLGEINLNPAQKELAIVWLVARLKDRSVDWIVARRCLETLVRYWERGDVSKDLVVSLAQKTTTHKSKATAKFANNLLIKLSKE